MNNATRSKKLSATTRRNWSDLHEDLLHHIAILIINIADLIAFRSVCVSWRSAAKIGPFDGARHFPWLLQATELDECSNKRSIIAVSGDGRLYETAILPRKFKSWCLASKGWVLFIDQDNVGSMCLLHAFTKTRINLPHKKSLQPRPYARVVLERAVLSSNPLSTDTYTLVIVYTAGNLAIWSPGNKCYTQLYFPRVRDVMFHKGRFYVATDRSVFELDCEIIYDTLTRVASMPDEWGCQYYLLEQGEDLLVLKGHPNRNIGNFSFTAFVVDLKGKSGELIEITDLGNRAIFIGDNGPFLVNNASQVQGCKPNHIYITHRDSEAGTMLRFKSGEPHIAAYNFAERRLEYLHCSRADQVCRCCHTSLWMQLLP